MNTKYLVTFLTLILIICVDGKKSLSGRGSSSARGSSRKTNYNPRPAPTSLSYAQPSAPKPASNPSLFGWQEKTGSRQAKPQNSQSGSQSHSYPSSQTGLSGNKQQAKTPSTNQENIQRSSASQNLNGQQAAYPAQTNSQPGHAYPASTGLSGNSGYPQQSQQSGSGISQKQGNSYPQQPGSALSGSGVPPPYSGAAAPPPYSGAAAPPYPGYNKPNGATYQSNNNYGNNYQHPQPPPAYSNNYGGYGGGHPSYHPSNGPQMPGHGLQSPGYFGNYANNGYRGGMSRGGSALTGVGIAGAGVGTLLTGLALWNLARSTGNRHHTVIYDNRGQPVAVAAENKTESEVNSMLADLVNCSLTISNDDKTEVLAIPCAIATSFTPDAEIKAADDNKNSSDNTKCTVTVTHKTGKEFMTTIPCSILLNSAAENNVTEPPLNIDDNVNSTVTNTVAIPTQTPLPDSKKPSALSLTSSEADQTDVDCTPEPGDIRDPINPCFSVTHNLTVIPLATTEKN